jgi:hypothetical protein
MGARIGSWTAVAAHTTQVGHPTAPGSALARAAVTPAREAAMGDRTVAGMRGLGTHVRGAAGDDHSS